MTFRKNARGRKSLPPEISGGSGRGGHQDRKVFQLCNQAQRALRFAFAESRDPVVQDLLVFDVQPHPGASRLLVLVLPSLSGGIDRATILAALGRAKGHLRTAVGHAVHRKRAPELVFELAPPDLEVASW